MKVSRKDRSVLVRFVNRYGDDAQQRFAPNGYPLDETGVVVERDRIGWYGGIVLLLSPRLSERLRHQQFVDQIVRKDWQDWERLDNSTLEALCRVLQARREEHICNVLTAGRSSLCLLAARTGSGSHTWKVWLEDRPEVWSLSEAIPFAVTNLLLGLRLPWKPLTSGLKELYRYMQNHPEKVMKALIGMELQCPDAALFDKREAETGESPGACCLVPISGTLVLLDQMGYPLGSGELYALVQDDHFHLYEVRRPHGGVPVIQEVQFAQLLAPFDGSTYRVVYTKTVDEQEPSVGDRRPQTAV